MTAGPPLGIKFSGQAPSIAPDHARQLGGSGANLVVSSGAASNSAAAPERGIVIVSLPANAVFRVRLGVDAEAVATDQPYYGPAVYHFPVLSGWRVSLYGDGTSGTAGVSMALGDGS